jgi:hypothetical protein
MEIKAETLNKLIIQIQKIVNRLLAEDTNKKDNEAETLL